MNKFKYLFLFAPIFLTGCDWISYQAALAKQNNSVLVVAKCIVIQQLSSVSPIFEINVAECEVKK